MSFYYDERETFIGERDNFIEERCCHCGCCPCCCEDPDDECVSGRELVRNGGMERHSNNKPLFWTLINPSKVSIQTAQGRVHSGNASVSIGDDAGIEQTIENVRGNVAYNFAFSARAEGTAVGLTAKVIFVTPTHRIDGATITIRQHDLTNTNRNFEYFHTITSVAPIGTISAIIKITVEANTNQKADVDDVLFYE